jgi:hypothetical protein
VIDIDSIGPVDVAVLGFADPGRGEVAAAILDLVEQGIVRIIDLGYVEKTLDGDVRAIEVVDSVIADAFAHLDDSFDLLNEDDLLGAADSLEPGTSALIVVWENTWAAKLALAVRNAGGVVIDQQRIPREAVVAAAQALIAIEEAS